MHSILVKDYMNHSAYTVKSGTNVRDVVQGLLKAGTIGAPVVNEHKQLVGFVSEQDCIKEMLNDAFYCEEPPAVNTVMRTDVSCVRSDTTIVELADELKRSRHKIYPVVEGGKLIGVINRSHILQALVENEEDCYLH